MKSDGGIVGGGTHLQNQRQQIGRRNRYLESIKTKQTKGFCKEFFLQKSEITMEVGGVSLGIFFFLVENRPKIALNQ